MLRTLTRLYHTDCRIFHWINKSSNRTPFLKTMKLLTHAGGSIFTIGLIIILCVFTKDFIRLVSFVAALSLILSHLVVVLFKRFLPRSRPYLVLPGAIVIENPFKDHSFPSGHTTAIFSISVPFMIAFNWLFFPLFIFATFVGISRIALGLHYPSDVLVGATLGTITGSCALFLLAL